MNDVPPITIIRFSTEQSREKAEQYLFGGRYGPVRVPRGLHRQTVVEFVREKVTREAEPEVFDKALHLARFYELAEVAEFWHPLWRDARGAEVRFAHAAYAIQAVGDFGDAAAGAQAAEFFDNVLVRHEQALHQIPLLAQTLVVLSPHGAIDALAKRVQTEVDRLAPEAQKSEEGLRAHQKISAYLRQDIAQARTLAAGKRRVLGLPPEARRQELVRAYLRRSALADPYIDEWAGRLLRREAREQEAQPIHKEFARAIDETIGPEAFDPKKHGFIVTRACQAILYLGGKLSDQHSEYQRLAQDAAMNFLWDDL